MVLVKLGLRLSGRGKVNFKPIHYKLQPRIPKHRVWIRVRVRVRVHYEPEHIVQMVSTLNKRLFYYYFFV